MLEQVDQKLNKTERRATRAHLENLPDVRPNLPKCQRDISIQPVNVKKELNKS
jgi:hypothetical protein